MPITMSINTGVHTLYIGANCAWMVNANRMVYISISNQEYCCCFESLTWLQQRNLATSEDCLLELEGERRTTKTITSGLTIKTRTSSLNTYVSYWYLQGQLPVYTSTKLFLFITWTMWYWCWYSSGSKKPHQSTDNATVTCLQCSETTQLNLHIWNAPSPMEHVKATSSLLAEKLTKIDPFKTDCCTIVAWRGPEIGGTSKVNSLIVCICPYFPNISALCLPATSCLRV